MRVEFFVNPSEGLSGVLAPVRFHDCPTSPRGRIQFGGRATLNTNGDRHILNLRCDAMPSIDADAIEELVRESTAYGPDFNPRQERGTLVVDIPLKGLRSQWTGDRLLCYAEVGQTPSSSMEIPGVRTVLVLCGRLVYFQDYFRDRQRGHAAQDSAEFGGTRYVYVRGQNWRGLRPEETRWATLGPCPVASLERLNEAEAIASRYERIFLEEKRSPVESRRYTAAEMVERRCFTGSSLRVVRRTFVDGEMVEEDVQIPQPSSMRIERMIVDDPIARHDSEEYLEEIARVRYATEIQRLATMELLGLDVSTSYVPGLQPYQEAFLRDEAQSRNSPYESYQEFRQRQIRQSQERMGIGDTSCINNARDRHLRCAVNPCGPCEGCEYFEKRDD